MESSDSTILSDSLTDLLIEHIRRLNEKLHGAFKSADIEVDLREIDELIRTVKQRDELVEELLKEETPEDERTELLSKLRAQRLLIAENRSELRRQYEKHHQILLTSIRLVVQSRQLVDKLSRRDGEYASEACASCRGLGGSSTSPCSVCNGKGTILVHQPSLPCPRCGGQGRDPRNPFALLEPEICLVCRGSGWVMTKDPHPM